MSSIRKAILIALCLLCCALLTGCYSDNDPFPTADQLSGGSAAVTLAPATDVPAIEPYATPDAVSSDTLPDAGTAAPVVTLVPATDVPATQPPATLEPLPEDAVDVSPNFNG